MPLFLVPRTNPIGDVTGMDAAIFRALLSTPAYGLKWVRTYHTEDAKRTYCVYEAASADDIRRYSLAANIPWDEIVEVGELTRDDYYVPGESVLRDVALAG